ncbi:hypothetical protein DRP07_09720 [Archaeoglobales archaeon]|nr:MAG: hypothetical protein DRP07_09720 [Archaeoglobales archaeon]
MIDFDCINELKNEDAEMLSASIKEWAEREVYPYRHEINDNREIVENAMKKLFVDVGMQKLVVPESLGGANVGYEELPAVLLHTFKEIGKADAGIGFVLASTLAAAISALGNEAFDFVAEKLCRDFSIVSIVLPQFGGSDFMGMRLVKAIEREGRIKLEGYARPLSSGVDADVFAVFCNYNGISAAFVDGSEVGRESGDAWMRLKTYLNLCLSSLCVGFALDSYRIVKDWSERRFIRGKQHAALEIAERFYASKQSCSLYLRQNA